MRRISIFTANFLILFLLSFQSVMAQDGNVPTDPTATPTETPTPTQTEPAPVEISPITPEPIFPNPPETQPETGGMSASLFSAIGIAILAGVVTLGWLKYKKGNEKKNNDPCQAIKESRDAKAKELSAVTKQFSLQESLIQKLKDELEEKKEALEGQMQDMVKGKVLSTLRNDKLNMATDAAERAKNIYDQTKDRYEKARNLLTILKTKKERLSIELGSLDSSYKQCLVSQASAVVKAIPQAKKIELVGAGKNVFIFHGTAGSPEENWFPWLKGRLEERGYKVFVPRFPTPNGQSLAAWFKVLEKYGEHFNENTILIGHSLGGMFVLRILEQIEYKIKAAVFVGTPIGIEPIANFTPDLNFSGFNFKWDKIKDKAENFVVYHSDNDPRVDIKNGRELAKQLGVKLTLVPNAGHFNTKSGYTKFEDLLRQVVNLK